MKNEGNETTVIERRNTVMKLERKWICKGIKQRKSVGKQTKMDNGKGFRKRKEIQRKLEKDSKREKNWKKNGSKKKIGKRMKIWRE